MTNLKIFLSNFVKKLMRYYMVVWNWKKTGIEFVSLVVTFKNMLNPRKWSICIHLGYLESQRHASFKMLYCLVKITSTPGILKQSGRNIILLSEWYIQTWNK